MQKRLGFKDDDIDDFLSKATAVEEAIKGLRDGTLDPKCIKIAGIDTEDEIREREVATTLHLSYRFINILFKLLKFMGRFIACIDRSSVLRE
jgi:hypothetical protein